MSYLLSQHQFDVLQGLMPKGLHPSACIDDKRDHIFHKRAKCATRASAEPSDAVLHNLDVLRNMFSQRHNRDGIDVNSSKGAVAPLHLRFKCITSRVSGGSTVLRQRRREGEGTDAPQVFTVAVLLKCSPISAPGMYE